MSEPKYERNMAELSEKEIKTLRDVALGPLDFKLVGEWSDDHLPCVGIELVGIQFGFWNLTTEAAAAFHYPDSQAAQKVVRELIVDGFEVWKEGDNNPENEKKDYLFRFTSFAEPKTFIVRATGPNDALKELARQIKIWGSEYKISPELKDLQADIKDGNIEVSVAISLAPRMTP